MAKLLSKGYSTRGAGGTLATKAAYLAPLIRYCFLHTKPFDQLNDSIFCEIVSSLYDATRVSRAGIVAANNNTSVRNIATTWLDFLYFIGELRGNSNYVSKTGAIEATKETKEVKGRGGATYLVSLWSHRAIAVGDAETRRLPITEEHIQKLREVASTSEDAYLRIRRLAMLELFDAVGMRRMEASLLPAQTVQSAVIASKAGGVDYSSPAYLEFPTVKGGLIRKVLLSPASLSYFAKYLKALKSALRQAGRAFDEKTPFFINSSTCEALNPNTFTLEIWELAREANISDPCSPHLIRHRYIVREFVRLVVAHDIENEDAFKKMLLDHEGILRKVQEITGHASLESLEAYINLAFEEVAELSETVSRAEMQAHLDALRRAKERYSADKARGIPIQEAADDLAAAIDATVARGTDASRGP